MKRFALLPLAAATVMMATATQAVADREGWPESFTMGTASQGGTFYIYGSGWANLIADELGDMSGGGEVTGGPTQNLALVHNGDISFA